VRYQPAYSRFCDMSLSCGIAAAPQLGNGALTGPDFNNNQVTAWSGGVYGELLDDGVREQFRGQPGDLLLAGGLGQLKLETLSLPHSGDLAEPEATAGTGDRLALRVMDLWLQHHVNDKSRHIPNSTSAGVNGVAAVPRPAAVRLVGTRPAGQ
jgi:hypothetical protein